MKYVGSSNMKKYSAAGAGVLILFVGVGLGILFPRKSEEPALSTSSASLQTSEAVATSSTTQPTIPVKTTKFIVTSKNTTRESSPSRAYYQYVVERSDIYTKLIEVNESLNDTSAYYTKGAVGIYDADMNMLLQMLPRVELLDIPFTPFSDNLVSDKNLLSKYARDLYTNAQTKRKIAADFSLGVNSNPSDYDLAFRLATIDANSATKGWDTAPSEDLTQISDNYNYILIAEKKFGYK
jgi:hypothetical protein